MASWPTGIEIIKGLLAANNLQKVAPSRKAATAMLAAAAKHLESASLVAQTDPDARTRCFTMPPAKASPGSCRRKAFARRAAAATTRSKRRSPRSSPSHRPETHSSLSDACGEHAIRSSTTTSPRSPQTTSPPTNLSSEHSTRSRPSLSTSCPSSSTEQPNPTSAHSSVTRSRFSPRERGGRKR